MYQETNIDLGKSKVPKKALYKLDNTSERRREAYGSWTS